MATGLFIESPQGMVFLSGGMYGHYKNFLSPSYYLQHVMIQQAIAKGLTRIHGINNVYDDSKEFSNFKKSFKGEEEEQLGTYTLIISSLKYMLYKKIINRYLTKLKSAPRDG